MKRAAWILCTLALLGSACGDDSSTTPTPTPTPTPTRIIRLGGNLNFGNITIGQQPPDGLLTVTNDGTSVLTVSGISAPCAGGAMTVVGSTSFAVAPQSTINVTVRFRPTVVESCTGSITVTSDATSGTNTIQITAAGVAPPRPIFTKTGVGDSVFDMPLDVARVRIIGVYRGFSSNFIVHIGGRPIVSVEIGIARQTDSYDATLPTGGGGVVSITNSAGVQWSFEEIR
jgi:hypothetical protein